MHHGGNDQDWIWLLAGTGDGVPIASALIAAGWRVEVSVVTASAAMAYRHLTVAAVHQGPLLGDTAIARMLERRPSAVIDATHPFAVRISDALRRVCRQQSKRLLRFERPVLFPDPKAAGRQLHPCVQGLQHVGQLNRQALQGSRLFIALGARHLAEAATAAEGAGAQVFARVLPSRDGVCQALAVGLPEGHLAVVHPRGDQPIGAMETALCRRWQITDVLCRESGGVTEGLWRDLAGRLSLRLWLLRRPEPPAGVEIVRDHAALLRHLHHDGLHQTDARVDNRV